MNLDRTTTAFDFDARLALVPAVDGKPVTLSGYAMIWGAVSSDRGGYRVRLLQGSAIPAGEVHVLSSHNYERLLGTTSNGSLRISPDDVGMRVEIDLAETTDGRDVAELVRRRDLRGMSFGISDEPAYTEETVDGLKIRNYSRFTFDEISVTPIPAFSQSVIEIKGDVADGVQRIGYDRRIAQSHQFDHLKFDSIRLPGPELSRRAV